MPKYNFSTKEGRAAYWRDYMKYNPEKRIKHNQQTVELRRKKREENKLNKNEYKSDLPFKELQERNK